MNMAEWTAQLDALRNGRLRLERQGESGLTGYASTALYELRQYVAAMEHGYRELSAQLQGSRSREKVRAELGLAQLREEKVLEARQWSRAAALGYAAMALNQSGLTPSQVVGLLELMEDMMDAWKLSSAETYYERLQSDPGGTTGDGETDSSAVPRNDNEGDCGRPMTAPTVGDVGPRDPVPTEGGEC